MRVYCPRPCLSPTSTPPQWAPCFSQIILALGRRLMAETQGKGKRRWSGYWISFDVHTGWVSGAHGLDAHDRADVPVNPAQHSLASQGKANVHLGIRYAKSQKATLSLSSLDSLLDLFSHLHNGTDNSWSMDRPHFEIINKYIFVLGIQEINIAIVITLLVLPHIL